MQNVLRLSALVLLSGVLALLPITKLLADDAATLKTGSGEAAKPAAATSEAKTVSPLRKLMDESISWTELFADERSATPMTSRVVMRWANNTRGSEDGMTVLLLSAGRPEAVFCAYPWMNNLLHEYDSLSRGTLLAKRDGVVVWSPEKPGVTFHAIPNADAPAETPVARLRQMKGLAAQFSSTMLGWKSDKSDREELRMLPQPLYRYESTRKDLLDGAVFGFVQGTDPETLLMLEAFKQGDHFEWQFAFARRTSGELEARHKDRVIWHADRFPDNDNPRSTHRCLSRPLDPSVVDALKEKGATP